MARRPSKPTTDRPAKDPPAQEPGTDDFAEDWDRDKPPAPEELPDFPLNNPPD